ncbi:hypothetical protein IX296_000695 [Bacteroides pyogenes]|nr:hypothetical protein [Bacteroides pyogenes]
MGGLVYRVHDGVTIVSEAPARKKSGKFKSANQIAQSLRFAMVVRYARERAADIRKDFQRDKMGTPHSKFIKLNIGHIGLATEKLLKQAYEKNQSVQDIGSDKIDAAIKTYVQAHPNTIYRTYKSGSYTFVSADGWAANGSIGGRGELGTSTLAADISKTARYKQESAAASSSGAPSVGGGSRQEAPDPGE